MVMIISWNSLLQQLCQHVNLTYLDHFLPLFPLLMFWPWQEARSSGVKCKLQQQNMSLLLLLFCCVFFVLCAIFVFIIVTIFVIIIIVVLSGGPHILVRFLIVLFSKLSFNIVSPLQPHLLSTVLPSGFKSTYLMNSSAMCHREHLIFLHKYHQYENTRVQSSHFYPFPIPKHHSLISILIVIVVPFISPS
jgi:hypothetical protein